MASRLQVSVYTLAIILVLLASSTWCLTSNDITFFREVASNWTGLPSDWDPDNANNACGWTGVSCDAGILFSMYEYHTRGVTFLK